jgi:hypothetical protein
MIAERFEEEENGLECDLALTSFSPFDLIRYYSHLQLPSKSGEHSYSLNEVHQTSADQLQPLAW